jgi:hypothetical protein
MAVLAENWSYICMYSGVAVPVFKHRPVLIFGYVGTQKYKYVLRCGCACI